MAKGAPAEAVGDGHPGSGFRNDKQHTDLRESIRIQDGWCDYPPVREGDIQECLKNWRGSDILGDCLNCPHFFPDRSGLRLKVMRDRKSAVDESSAFLIQMIEQVRQGLRLPETIAAAMARLQDDSRRYANTLYRNLEMEGNHGSSQEEQFTDSGKSYCGFL